ncbi:MAG: hypothetical protein JWN72_1193 [Thermoleophilia bacterium]|nr:hypothetical protein [Thermoleophilia bacterium]
MRRGARATVSGMEVVPPTVLFLAVAAVCAHRVRSGGAAWQVAAPVPGLVAAWLWLLSLDSPGVAAGTIAVLTVQAAAFVLVVLFVMRGFAAFLPVDDDASDDDGGGGSNRDDDGPAPWWPGGDGAHRPSHRVVRPRPVGARAVRRPAGARVGAHRSTSP